jgi:hypothetical protein
LDGGRLVSGCAGCSAGSTGIALGAQVGEDQHHSNDHHQHGSDHNPGFLLFAHFTSPVSKYSAKNLSKNSKEVCILSVCGRAAYPMGAKSHTLKMRFFYYFWIVLNDTSQK